MQQAVESFLEMLLAERGAAKNTVEAYRRDLSDFAGYLAKKKWQYEQVTLQDLESYIASLSKKGAAASTQSRRTSALKQFFLFCQSEGWRGDNPAALLTLPKRARNLPKVMSEEEVDRLLTAAAEHKDKRIHVLLEMLYASGLRVSELVSLKRNHLQRDATSPHGFAPFLIVTGKGNKERLAPLNGPALEAVADYLGSLAEEKSAGAYLFPSRGKDGHLTRQRFWQMLKALARDAGLDENNISPHVLRHAFASHLLAGGADLRVIQELLGHADIATTQIYTHLTQARLHNLVREKHPLAQG